jgi:hypothetical protein
MDILTPSLYNPLFVLEITSSFAANLTMTSHREAPADNSINLYLVNLNRFWRTNCKLFVSQIILIQFL